MHKVIPTHSQGTSTPFDSIVLIQKVYGAKTARRLFVVTQLLEPEITIDFEQQ